MSSALRDGLLAILDDVDAAVREAAPVCDLSGRCCRFREYGHTLFISRPEAELLLQQGIPAGAAIDESGCPFQQGVMCTARERRPLGCRVYFCDPLYAGRGETISEEFIGRLKDLHRVEHVSWEYRPLHHFLREAIPPTATAEIPCAETE